MIQTKSIRTRKALVVEDDLLFARQLGLALDHIGDQWNAEYFRAGAPVLERIDARGFYADLALVDLGLPDVSGLEVIRRLHGRLPDLPILVISVVTTEQSLLAAIKAGASGYLIKDEDEELIAKGICDVLLGRFPISPSLARYLFRLAGSPQLRKDGASIELTRREMDVLEAIARSMTYEEVALHLGVSLSTVQSHIRNLYSKLGAHSQVQAINEAREKGLLP